MDLDRREFLNFMGKASAAALLALPSYSPAQGILNSINGDLPDDVILKPGFKYKTLMQWGDPLNSNSTYGYNNDFVACMPLNEKELLLFVNHETLHPSLMSMRDKEYTKDVFEKERKEVGFSCFVVSKNGKNWELVKNHPLNNRVDAATRIPFSEKTKIQGSDTAMGTFANCAGGQTPWGTFLSCEENYDDFVGERTRDAKLTHKDRYNWKEHWNPAPEHYGWVVEYNPQTKEAQKLVALGRFAHEGALVVEENTNVVVYMGDDKENECVYKFVSSGKNLTRGKLYVANLDKGEWLLLDRDSQPKLKAAFKTQNDVLTYTREAAQLMGASKLGRPEDIKRDPTSGSIFVALTSHKNNGLPYGALLKINEENGPSGLKFNSSIFLSGGPKTGFACPDNLAFDKKGNLWMTSDISEKALGQGEFKDFKRNGLYYIPMKGKNAGRVELIAWAPPDAELTGPCFTPDNKLLVAVQHPGASSVIGGKMTSHWPRGNKEIPRPSLIEISGRALDSRLS